MNGLHCAFQGRVGTDPEQKFTERPHECVGRGSATTAIVGVGTAMTAAQIVARNQANAQKSTGPKTPKGKAVVSQNAVKHGGLALSPVIAGAEDPAAWEEHRAGVLASLHPEGRLEEVLAERVALSLWRLTRLARAEQAAVTQEQRQAGTDAREHVFSDRIDPDGAAVRLGRAQAAVRALRRLPDVAEAELLEDAEAVAVLGVAAAAVGIEDYDELSYPFVPKDEFASEYEGWTAKQLRQALSVVVKAAKVPLSDLQAVALRAAQREFVLAKQHADEVNGRLELLRLTRLLPEQPLQDRLMRYESHLTRPVGAGVARAGAAAGSAYGASRSAAGGPGCDAQRRGSGRRWLCFAGIVCRQGPACRHEPAGFVQLAK
jgi:hypothetical protein